jgi:pimeloyl-ACP methyl ester carboxylesterase
MTNHDYAMAAPRLQHTLAGGRGPYLFMLHGMLSSRLQWQPNLAALATVSRPVMFELWGHGLSPVPHDDEAYAVDAYLDEFERVRRERGVERVILCGQSFGAGFMLRYAIRHPERVQGLIFTNSTSALADSSEEARAPLLRILESGEAGALESLPMHPRFARRLDPALREQLVGAAAQISVEAVIKSLCLTAPQVSVARELHRITCPTLLVNGVWESGFQRHRDLAARTIAHCRVVNLLAGHAVNLEDAAGFNEAALRFIREA